MTVTESPLIVNLPVAFMPLSARVIGSNKMCVGARQHLLTVMIAGRALEAQFASPALMVLARLGLRVGRMASIMRARY